MDGQVVGFDFDIEIAEGGERGGALGMLAAGLNEDAAGFVVIVDAAIGEGEADFCFHAGGRALQDRFEAGDCGGEIARGEGVFGVLRQIRELLWRSFSMSWCDSENCGCEEEFKRPKQGARGNSLVGSAKSTRKHAAIIASRDGAAGEGSAGGYPEERA